MSDNKTKFQYINDLSIKLSRYESMRKEALKTLIKSEIITFIITLIIGCIMYLFSLNYGWLNSIEALLIMGLLLCLFLLISFPAYFDKGLGEKMKDFYRKELEETFNINMKGPIINFDILVKSDLFSDFNIYSCDDVIEGTYNGVTYRISEFYEEIVSIQKLIDHFKLNEKTGL